MSRHYRDSHPDLLRRAQMHQYFVHGLANFGSGRGECPMCRIKTQNVQKHQCCAVYQLAAMTGYIFQPEHFPTMPYMMRPWHRSVQPGDDQLPDEAPTPTPAPKKQRLSEASPMDCARETTSHADVPPDHGPFLYKCNQCQACFLSATGLQQHIATQYSSSNTVTAEPPMIPKRGRPPGKDTIQSRLAQPSTTEIPILIQDFTCPLCHETIGRKAISTHLRAVHQVEKPKKFRFSPSKTWCRVDSVAPIAKHHLACPLLWPITLTGEHVRNWSWTGYGMPTMDLQLTVQGLPIGLRHATASDTALSIRPHPWLHWRLKSWAVAPLCIWHGPTIGIPSRSKTAVVCARSNVDDQFHTNFTAAGSQPIRRGGSRMLQNIFAAHHGGPSKRDGKVDYQQKWLTGAPSMPPSCFAALTKKPAICKI